MRPMTLQAETPVLTQDELAHRLAMLEAIKDRAQALEDWTPGLFRIIALTILTIGGIALTLVGIFHAPQVSVPLKVVPLLVFIGAVVLSVRSKNTEYVQEQLLEAQVTCYPALDTRTFTQLQTVDRHHGKLHPTAVLRWVSIEAQLLNGAITASREAKLQSRMTA